jgi:hypothetical protein
MKPRESVLTVDGRTVLVQRKSIKNMYLRVDQQTGWLKVSAPRFTSDLAIVSFVHGREAWIEKALANEKQRASQPVRTFSAADRRAFRAKCAASLERWQPLVGRRASGFSVRDMKTRWGSCNTRTGHLNFNLKLLDLPQECLDYVVVHELCHLWVNGHSKAFWTHVERVYPGWRRVRKELRKRQ